MAKNKGIAIIAIDSDKSTHKHSKWAKYGIAAWELYCRKYNLNLHVISKIDSTVHHPKWMKIKLFEQCPNWDEYLLVDNDTMPSWLAPNIFEKFPIGFHACEDSINLRWINSSVSNYRKAFFYDAPFNYGLYFNSGVLRFSRPEHDKLFDTFNKFYVDNKNTLEAWNVPHTGMDQTILNFLIQQSGIEIKFMGHTWNQHNIQNFGLLQTNFQTGDKMPYYIKTGNIWHFTGMGVEFREPAMKSIWEAYQSLYKL